MTQPDRAVVPVKRPDAHAPLTISVVDDARGFAALRREWTDLLAGSDAESLFLTWEWLHTWWSHFAADRRLFIVTIRAGSELIAIAPLTKRRSWAGPVLEFAGTGIIGSDYLDVIARRSWETEAVAALARFIGAEGTSVRLPRVSESSAIAVALGHELKTNGWTSVAVPTEVCPFIDLSACSWDDYLRTLGASHRYNFKRRLRNLMKEYDVRVRYAQSDAERRQALQHVVNLHLKRWSSRGGSDAFTGPGVLAFHEEFSRLAQELGWLRLSVLELDGKPAAAFYCLRHRGTFHFYQSGFDPAFERSSVGLVMMGMTIRDAIAEGAAHFDFLHGDEPYKFLWTSRVRRLIRLELYPPGRIGRIQRLTAETRRLARRVLTA